MALPDGAHNYDSDTTFFHLPYLNSRPGKKKTLYGVSCYRQMDSKDLKNKCDDVTRTTVQKAVCVLSQMPVYGYIQAKLEVATKVYFEEKDFSRVGILKELYNSLNNSLSGDMMVESLLNVGLSIMDLVMRFRQRILVLFKLLLLEKKVIFYGFPVAKLGSQLLSLISLIPGMLESGLVQSACMDDTPYQDNDQDPLYPSHLNPAHLNTDQYGLPLEIFTENSLFHPYLSLQQIDLLKNPKVDSFVVGVSNALYCQQRNTAHVLVELQTTQISIRDENLTRALTLSTADLRFTDYLVQHVTEYNKSGGQTVGWDGSEEWIRAQFKLYILSLLSSIQHTDGESLANYNEEFITAWKSTRNFTEWNSKQHVGIDEVHAGHPFQGQIGLSDLKIRLSNVYQDVAAKSMQTDQGRKIGQAVAQTGRAVGGALNSARSFVASWLLESSPDDKLDEDEQDRDITSS
ncbi:late secretory pathway protein AVL9 homolog isoform X2 [Nematostella vectensis]|nr:late secretory pathway protein AVL9 homolog isoform X2 [Nematostella vectensis]